MESSTITDAPASALDAPTITEAFRRTAANHPDILAVRTADDSLSLTWSELLARVDALAGGLAKLGVRRGDTVAIMLGNRPEFQIADLAIAMLGATPFSIYVTYPAEEIRYLCSDADSGWRWSSRHSCRRCWRRVGPGWARACDRGRWRGPEGTLPLSEVEGSGQGFDGAQAAAAVGRMTS